jgi:hypothetical protein
VSAIASLSVRSWNAPVDASLQAEAVRELELGHVLFLPDLAFGISEEEEALIAATTTAPKIKNVSFDPVTGRCKGAELRPEAIARLKHLLRRFGRSAYALISALIPDYADGLELARASYRPIEVATREMKWRKDDRLMHVDAFPSRPVRGRRILRVFNNVNAEGQPRRWRVGEPFEAHASRFLPSVRLAALDLAPLLALIGVTKGRRSRYDALMLGLHDAAKRDRAYQSAAAETFDFPPGSTWIVYTDQTPHCAIAGRGAFEQTFHLDPGLMARPEQTPLGVLSRATGRALV